jgi:hypothetical protein
MSAGKYLTIQIYPEYAKFNKGKRRSKHKPTSEAQRKINKQAQFWKLVHLCNENFKDGKDYKIELTYDNENLPNDLAQAKKDIVNFKRRVNRVLKKKGLPTLKCVSVIEQGSKSGRFHHHLIISDGLSWDELDEIWGKGYTRATKLKFDKQRGLQGLVAYMLKSPVHEEGKAAYSITRNMVEPMSTSASGRISHRDLQDLATCTDSSMVERLFPEFELVGNIEPFYNDAFGAFYFFAQFVRREKR